MVVLLEKRHTAAHAQANLAVNVFLDKIKNALKKHVLPESQGPLIANALSTAMQFEMSIWWMVRDECVQPMHTKHSDWCRLAGIVQSLVKMISNNCTIMFLDPPVPSGAPALTSSRPLFSDEDEDEEMLALVSQSSFEVLPLDWHPSTPCHSLVVAASSWQIDTWCPEWVPPIATW